ncbi:MAG: hypothetical protein V1789_04650 [PVC group bacterium]
MKKPLLTALVVLVTLMISTAPRAGDFREADWGMTVKEVRATEKDLLPIVDNDPAAGSSMILGLKYIGTLGGSPAMISYFFSRGKLVQGEYYIESNILKDSGGTYQTIKSTLYQKYGDPVSEVERRSNDLFRIPMGWVVKWRTERTGIVFSIKKPEGSITLTYTDRTFQDISVPKTLSQEL